MHARCGEADGHALGPSTGRRRRERRPPGFSLRSPLMRASYGLASRRPLALTRRVGWPSIFLTDSAGAFAPYPCSLPVSASRATSSFATDFVTDQPIVVAARWHGTLAPSAFADEFLTLFAAPAILFAGLQCSRTLSRGACRHELARADGELDLRPPASAPADACTAGRDSRTASPSVPARPAARAPRSP